MKYNRARNGERWGQDGELVVAKYGIKLMKRQGLGDRSGKVCDKKDEGQGQDLELIVTKYGTRMMKSGTGLRARSGQVCDMMKGGAKTVSS